MMIRGATLAKRKAHAERATRYGPFLMATRAQDAAMALRAEEGASYRLFESFGIEVY